MISDGSDHTYGKQEGKLKAVAAADFPTEEAQQS